jgi:hypothetical protein
LGFTVRWLTQRPASPRGHRPPDGDVLGRIHVGMFRMSASAATKDRLALAVFGSTMPAGTTDPRRVCGVDLFYPARGLLLQAGYEPAPPSRTDGTVEPSLGSHASSGFQPCAACGPSHIADVQIFHPYLIKTTGQVGGGLFRPVLTPIHFAGLQPGNRGPGAFAAVRVSLRACQSPLQAEQTFRLTVAKTGDRQEFAGRKRSRDGNATVHTDDLSRTRTVNHRRDRGQRDVPPARPVPGDAVGPDVLGYVTGPAESNPANLRNPHLADLARQSAYIPMAAAPSDDAEPLVPPGLTPRRAAVRPCEEVAYCPGEVPQRLLLHRLRPGRQPRKFSPCCGQLSALLSVCRRARAPWAPIRVLFDRKVPDKTGVRAVFQQRPFLRGRWLKPESHAGHATERHRHSRKERSREPSLCAAHPMNATMSE